MKFSEGEIAIFVGGANCHPDWDPYIGSEVEITNVGPFHKGQMLGFERIGINGDYIVRMAHYPAIVTREQWLRKRHEPGDWDKLTDSIGYDMRTGLRRRRRVPA